MIFFSFSYYNFEDSVTNSEKDMFRKEFLTRNWPKCSIIFALWVALLVVPIYSVVQTLIVK